MPKVLHPQVLAAVYRAATSLIEKRQCPTTPLYAGHTLFRSVPSMYIPKPAAGGFVSKFAAREALMPRDGTETEKENRFSGPSLNKGIPGVGGLYCVLQQQALVNEVMHYGKRAGLHKRVPRSLPFAEGVLLDKVVLKIVLMDRFLMADLSPHNPGAEEFLERLQAFPGVQDALRQTQQQPRVKIRERLEDSEDCSVARGIGLAVAAAGPYRGLLYETVRKSERSAEERGDNVVLYGDPNTPVPGIYVDEAYYFDRIGEVDVFPVSFPGSAGQVAPR